MSGKSAEIECLMFLDKNKSQEIYKEEFKKWSRTISIEKKIQAEFVIYSLDGHSLGIKEKIQDGIGDKLEQNEQGIDEFIKFLDRIYLKAERLEASDVLTA